MGLLTPPSHTPVLSVLMYFFKNLFLQFLTVFTLDILLKTSLASKILDLSFVTRVVYCKQVPMQCYVC